MSKKLVRQTDRKTRQCEREWQRNRDTPKYCVTSKSKCKIAALCVVTLIKSL